MSKIFYFDLTDTFGGEANYSWVHYYKIKAKNIRGALIKLSRETGYNFRFDGLGYKAKRACVRAMEIEYIEDESCRDWREL